MGYFEGCNVQAHKETSSLDDLFTHILEEWEKIPKDFLATLVESMPRRIQAVIDNKGSHTKY
jgi:hypothetical protein